MVQREVAERMAAGPGHQGLRDAVGVGAALHQDRAHAAAGPLDLLSAAARGLEPGGARPAARGRLPPVDPARLRTVIQAAFGQRRKTLVNALSAGLAFRGTGAGHGRGARPAAGRAGGAAGAATVRGAGPGRRGPPARRNRAPPARSPLDPTLAHRGSAGGGPSGCLAKESHGMRYPQLQATASYPFRLGRRWICPWSCLCRHRRK